MIKHLIFRQLTIEGGGAITFALILQKFRLRLSYTCAHKSGAFALSFGVTLARIFSQLALSQLLVFEPRC